MGRDPEHTQACPQSSWESPTIHRRLGKLGVRKEGSRQKGKEWNLRTPSLSSDSAALFTVTYQETTLRPPDMTAAF